MGTFEQFMQVKEEQKQEESEAEAAASNQMVSVQNADNSYPVIPNIIGNAEDMQSVQRFED